MGFLSFLTKGLGKTRNNLSMKLDGFSGKLSEDTLEELEEILILSDVSVATAGKICSMLGAKMKKRSIDAKNLRTELRDTIVELLSPDVGLDLSGRPAVIMMVGVNGVGKTTTIGKLAHYLITEGKTVLLGAADTFRAAAGEQLEIWAQRNHCQMIRHAEGADPAAVVFDTIAAGKARNIDVILCDTAGRLHNKKNLMDELSKMNRIILREAPDSSREVLLVLDATTGQNGLSQAKLFAEACGVTGVVLTKLDGTAKGGVVISIREQLGLPIKLVGVGEQLEDLKPFSAYEYATALLFDEGTT
ncbi:MAG: signal recognition particle-docking protein FtsY [Angelakisella sp.]